MTSSTTCHVREARRDDVPAIAALAAEFSRYMRSLGDVADFRLDADALERDGFGPSPAFRGLVAERSGEIVGYLLHHAGYDTDAACRLLFVVDLYVTGAARGPFDMVGNLHEWVADWTPKSTACGTWNPSTSLTGDIQCFAGAAQAGEPGALARGGGFFDQALAGPLAVVDPALSVSADVIGFRCVR
jgi:hypothetical protein